METHQSKSSDCVFTFIISSENKDPVTCHYLKLAVFGWSGHLDGSQWDHSFRVDVLKHEAGERKLRKPGVYKSQCRYSTIQFLECWVTVCLLFLPLSVLYVLQASVYTCENPEKS